MLNNVTKKIVLFMLVFLGSVTPVVNNNITMSSAQASVRNFSKGRYVNKNVKIYRRNYSIWGSLRFRHRRGLSNSYLNQSVRANVMYHTKYGIYYSVSFRGRWLGYVQINVTYPYVSKLRPASSLPKTDMVDMSNYQRNVSVPAFTKMRQSGVKAITLKVTEGTNFVDRYALNNMRNARAAGLSVNAYHFSRYHNYKQAVSEANFACNRARAIGLPLGAVMVSDVESSQQGSNSYNANQSANNAFEKTVSLRGYRPDIYTMGSWVNRKFSVPNRTGWIANYPNNPRGKVYYSNHHAWQWNSRCRFRGVGGIYDISMMYDNYYINPKIPTVSGAISNYNVNSNDNNMVTIEAPRSRYATSMSSR